MFLQQFFVEGLGHASYLIASDTTREAAVVDPRRDVEVYVAEAQRNGFVLRYAFETHNHNDFLSGAYALARRFGLTHVASAEAELRFPYHAVRDGDELALGELRIKVLATPGHTPEHVTYVVVDTARAPLPVVVFSGGDLLVGSVGRPDLLGKELGARLAPLLYDSLHGKILTLEDYVEVLPTHGTGSLCGKRISSKRTSTIGYERRFNPQLRQNKEDFVRDVLSGNPGIPAYYSRMRPANQQGPRPWLLPEPRPLAPAAVDQLAGQGALVLDTRPNVAFAAGHVPGAVNIGLDPFFATWVGWLLPADVPLILVLEDEALWAEAVTALARVGYEQIAGYLRGGIAAWREAGLPVVTVQEWTVQDLWESLAGGGRQVLDVRMDDEWQSGHIPGARHLSLDRLEAGLAALDPVRPYAAICGSGYRSSAAVSLLQRHGFLDVANVLGGMEAWQAAGYPTTKEDVARQA